MQEQPIQLTEVLKGWRHSQQMEAKEAAKKIGIPYTVYFRLERGENLGGQTLAHLLRWLLGARQ